MGATIYAQDLDLSNLTAHEVEELLQYLSPEEQVELLRLSDITVPIGEGFDFAQYADDPQGFGRDLFGEFYTPDQIKVAESVRDNPITIVESANATGKSHIAARVAAWWYKTRDEAQVYTAAAPPLENLTKILWGELGYLTNTFEHTVFKGDRVNFLSISRDSRNFITGVAIPSTGTPAQREAKFSGKHAKNLLFVLDEGDAIPEEVYKGIESCLSGGNGRLLIMYNPRSDEGPIAAMKARGVPVITLTAFNHPNVLTGKDVIPGAVSRNKTLHRMHQWSIPATPENEEVIGYGRYTVPDFLAGEVAFNEETKEMYPPMPAGQRIITQPEFAYMVLGIYPGSTRGVIYDVWRNTWATYRKELAKTAPSLLARIESQERFPISRDDLPGWADDGNVSPFFDYEEGAGAIYWAIDDGYAGSREPLTGMFTADSHPRVIGFYQVKPNGDIVRFDEMYQIREPKPERQIKEARKRPYPPPELVVIGPGSAALGGTLAEEGYFKRTCMADVEESIKHLRKWIAKDENGHRRFKVHPRCKHFCYEMERYRRDENGRIIKAYDHGCFVAGTMVHTAVTTRPIEAIRPGEMVLTRSGYKRVIDGGMTNQEADTVTVLLSDGRQLTCTADHPIWVDGAGFIEAQKLRADHLVRDVLGDLVRVLGVVDNDEKTAVFNLTVEGVPEFFANGVLVHNCDEARYLCWTGRNGW